MTVEMVGATPPIVSVSTCPAARTLAALGSAWSSVPAAEPAAVTETTPPVTGVPLIAAVIAVYFTLK